MISISSLIPTISDLQGFGAVLVSAVLMAGVGRLITPRMTPEINLVVGWGILCLVLTLWGCATTTSLAIPTILFGLAGAGGILRHRNSIRHGTGAWRVAILSIPIWLVMIPVAPSQVDTWLNLLPNAAYLVDHGYFPRYDRPPSYSFIPVAPYNTQFVGYAASLLRGALVGNAMGLFNVLLQGCAGVILARLVAGQGGEISWGAAAFGLLLAIPLNPGFLPHVFFAPYGEAPLAVTSMAAVLLGAQLLSRREQDPGYRRELLIAVAFVLAAMVNIKQSAIGLFLSIEVSAVLLLIGFRRDYRARWGDILHLLPALLLYCVWRWYATNSFAVGELKALPVSQWNIPLIPEILGGVVHAIAQKGTYFGTVLLLFVATVIATIGRDHRGVVPAIMLLGCGTVLFDNFFIIFTYIAHFPPDWAIDAHSYFRYMTQVSLVVVLGLTVFFLEPARRWLARLPAFWRRRCAMIAVLLILIAPFAAIGFLRFDLEAPQPDLTRVVTEMKPYLRSNDPLAVLVPGDHDDIAGSYVRGLLLYHAPRERFSEIRTETGADPITLGTLAAAGYHQAVLSCSSRAANSAGLPPKAMVLLGFSAGRWHVVSAWAYPSRWGKTHWAALLPRSSFCGDLS